MSSTDVLLRNAESYANGFDKAGLPLAPDTRVAVVACMDARLNLYALLGLAEGDAHIIRNAGGAVTADAARSLAISQRFLGTREVVLLHHTDCGMLIFTHDEFARRLEEETGLRPEWNSETFTDLDAEVRQSIRRVRTNPFIPHTDRVRGFVYEVETGRLREVAE